MLEWIYYMRPENSPANYIPQERSEDTPFIKGTKDILVRKTTEPPKICLGALLPRTELIGNANREFGPWCKQE